MGMELGATKDSGGAMDVSQDCDGEAGGQGNSRVELVLAQGRDVELEAT